MDELLVELIVHFPTQPGHMDVYDVVQGRVTTRFFPDIAGQHFAGDHVALMTNQVFQKLELARGQIQV